jgi:hypothetical protein
MAVLSLLLAHGAAFAEVAPPRVPKAPGAAESVELPRSLPPAALFHGTFRSAG